MAKLHASITKGLITGLFALLVLVVLMPAKMAQALELGRFEASHSSVALHSEYQTLAADETFWLGVQIDPREGWHSYWKNYGDSGAAPIFDWTFPGGVTAGDALYPTPHRMPVGPLMNYGYEEASVLLIPLTIDAAFATSSLDFSVYIEWLVCEIECIPQDATLAGSFTVGEMAVSEAARGLFADARTALPELPIWSAKLDVYDAQSRLKVFLTEAEVPNLSEAYFFPAGEGVTEYAAEQQWSLTEEGLFVDMRRMTGGLEASSGEGVLLLTYADGSKRAVEIDAKLETQGAAAAAQTGAAAPKIEVSLPLWQAFAFALLGGMVLNLMPCVFPVLSLKAFSFISANAKSASERQQEGWSYTAGIWISFMVIVAILLIIKSGGTAIGWGFQLQEPAFVGSMVLLMVLVALSLSGMFNITVGVEGAGQELAAQSGNKGAFFQGVLAALVATPCTAPLMAPAIGFALTQPALILQLLLGQ